MYVVWIASVNINGIRNETRMGMFRDFIRSNDLDIILVQEVTAPESVDTPGYKSYTSIESKMRVTAILARKDLHATHIDILPSGRAIALVFSGIRLINVYSPSGTTKSTERE
jgi:exonuclease III